MDIDEFIVMITVFVALGLWMISSIWGSTSNYNHINTIKKYAGYLILHRKR